MVVVETWGLGTVIVVVDTERLTVTAADGQDELATTDEGEVEVLSEQDGLVILLHVHVVEGNEQAISFVVVIQGVIVTFSVVVEIEVSTKRTGLTAVVARI